MYYKCELLAGGLWYAVTDCIKNWDEITASFKRNDYDGVVRTFTDKFEFVRGARQILMDEYQKNYLKSSASIVIYTRNNSWTWTERFRCALNFSTLSDDGFVCSMNAVDDSVSSLIKAKKGTQYEYSVDVVKDSIPLMYDHLMMQNFASFLITPNNTDAGTIDIEMKDSGYYTLPVYLQTDEISVQKDFELADQTEMFYEAVDYLTENPYFFLNKSGKQVRMRFSVKLHVEYTNTESKKNDILYLQGSNRAGHSHILLNKVLTGSDNISLGVYGYVSPGERISCFIHSQYGGGSVKITPQSELKIEWNGRLEAAEYDVVRPVVLLNRLLKSMNGGKEGLSGVIVPSGERRLDNAVLLAAESVRKLPGAKIYSSFTQFCNWMSAVFGYVYDINGNVITFRPRKDYFGDNVVKSIGNYNGYSMSVNSSLIYSQVNVGYEKQDYDSVNGKDEFRFTNIYNTGITMTDNKLELISPYRADSYGIEFLSQQVGEDTTDNSSDTGVFFVCAQSDGTRYTLDRSDSISGVISPSTMFNAMYSPTSMIEANKDFLGGFVSELNYASSEGNTAVIINGEAENRDISLGDGLFSVDEVEVETSDIELPDDMTGLVELEHQGEIVRGYYKSADFHYTKTKKAKITLIVKK